MTNTILSNPTIELLAGHQSVRSFTDQPVSDDMVEAIVATARRAPTSSNWQTYSVIVIRDPQTRAQLAGLTGGQGHVEQSQVVLAFAADIHRLHQAGSLHGTEPAGGLNQTLVSIVDATIVGQTAQIAAEALGLGAVMNGGMRLKPKEISDLLALPDGVFVVFGMSIGWPDGDPSAPGLKPRLPADLVVHNETYSDDGADDLIRAYNADLKAYYEGRGYNLDDDAWSGPVARRSSEPSYTKLHDFLVSHGFSLD